MIAMAIRTRAPSAAMRVKPPPSPDARDLRRDSLLARGH